MSTRTSRWKERTAAATARSQYVRPLYDYVHNHGINWTWIARHVERRTGRILPPSTVTAIAHGLCYCPPGFITIACAVLNRTPQEVMGERWCAEHATELTADKLTADRLIADRLAHERAS